MPYVYYPVADFFSNAVPFGGAGRKILERVGYTAYYKQDFLQYKNLSFKNTVD